MAHLLQSALEGPKPAPGTGPVTLQLIKDAEQERQEEGALEVQFGVAVEGVAVAVALRDEAVEEFLLRGWQLAAKTSVAGLESVHHLAGGRCALAHAGE